MNAPLTLQYHGEGEFRTPSRYWASVADRELVVGETYRMVEHHDRSANSHRHYFAALHDAWQNLPDELLEIYPTAEHLRKKALIRKGYRDEREHVCASKAEAQRLAATIKPLDDYAIIEARECVVRIWTAKSQSVKAMPAGEFQRSKQDVLDFVAALIGVEADELARAA